MFNNTPQLFMKMMMHLFSWLFSASQLLVLDVSISVTPCFGRSSEWVCTATPPWPAYKANPWLKGWFKALGNPIQDIVVPFYNPWEVRQKLTSGSDELKRTLYHCGILYHYPFMRGRDGVRACSTWWLHSTYWHVHIYAFILLTALQGNPRHLVDKQTKANKWI